MRGMLLLIVWASYFLYGCAEKSGPQQYSTGEASNDKQALQQEVASNPIERQSVGGSRPGGDRFSSASSLSELPQFPLEAALMRDKDLNVTAIRQLKSKDFAGYMRAFRRETEADSTAQAMTRSYENAIAVSMKAFPESSGMSDFACGSRLCMGYARSSQGDEWFPAWYQGFARNTDVSLGAVLAERVALPNGDIENRLIFSTERGSGVHMPPPGR